MSQRKQAVLQVQGCRPFARACCRTEYNRHSQSPNAQNKITLYVLKCMQVTVVFFLLLSYYTPTTHAEGTCEAPEMLRPKFVLFGDSLTQKSFEDGGFGAGLTNAYQRKVFSECFS